MNRTLTWLHLSDLHARLRNDWDARQVTDSLVRDLKLMQQEYGLRPDFVFFTGDLAFGAVDGETMDDQYQLVRSFLDAVRKAFDPEIPIRNLYLVPGNHDVDRGEITPEQTAWLRMSDRPLAEIQGAMADGKKQWRSWMERLADYRRFLTSYGLLHLAPDDPHLMWADGREIADFRIGIAGLNSAWSCAGKDEKGKLWFGVDWQLAKLKERMGPVDFSFALLHHPGGWFMPQEGSDVMRRLRQEYAIVLHGHDHDEWVEVDGDQRLVLSAAACYNSSWMANGYSFGRIDLDQRQGEIRLRQWDASGRGWVARNVAGKTKDGLWTLPSLPWLTADRSVRIPPDPPPTPEGEPLTTGESAEENYTRRYCMHVIDKHDVLELFGCDIPRELQRHQLSVAYVSLNLASEDEDNLPPGPSLKRMPMPLFAKPDLPEDAGEPPEEIGAASTTIEHILDRISAGSKRLLINGPAGAGKSTLLRWCAIQAAQQVLSGATSPLDFHHPPAHPPMPDSYAADGLSPPPGAWRQKIPLLIRLRDCPTGQLPAARELPTFLAKHLPTAPPDWMTNLLDSGQAIVLFDGVDEIHRDRRPQLAEEIGELIRTYPNCLYVVTTRPGAVAAGWLERQGFAEARVEPMSRRDRDEFIDKWYRSATQELKSRPRPGEDLPGTATRLKTELAEQLELGKLATNPLLCAMICALYRDRQEKLPETPAELSEALCHMLLHRRERETPGLIGSHFSSTWRALTYPQKKELLAELAWQMVSHGESALEITVATSMVASSLDSIPGRIPGEAEEVVQALVERSGLLRPASDGRIDFLHNTLKEYLAAGRVVADGDCNSLAAHADDPAWQPVILFALALAPEPFSSGLVGKLLNRVVSPKSQVKKSGNLSKRERKALATIKARQFFLVRCRAAAKRLAAELSNTIDGFLVHLLPPASMNEVEALAQIGPRILPYAAATLEDSSWWPRQSCHTLARCLRLIRLIGGPRAHSMLKLVHGLPSNSVQVNNEWLLACTELSPDERLPWPFPHHKTITSLDLSSSAILDISRVAELTSLRHLRLARTWVTSIEPLKGLKLLEFLSLSSTLVRDLSPLSELVALHFLDLSSTPVRDLSPLSDLQSLKTLLCPYLWVSDLSPLAGLKALEHLYLWGCQVTDLSPLTGLQNLRALHLDGLRGVNDLSPLAGLSSLRWLDVAWTQVGDLAPLVGLPKLKQLSLEGTLVTDLSPLIAVASLQQISLSFSQKGESFERFKAARPDVAITLRS